MKALIILIATLLVLPVSGLTVTALTDEFDIPTSGARISPHPRSKSKRLDDSSPSLFHELCPSPTAKAHPVKCKFLEA